MQDVTRKQMRKGVELTCITTEKFKSAVLRVAFILPLGGVYAAERAVLPFVLRRGTKNFPDMTKIGGKLDALYGARIEPMVRREGENLVIGFGADVIDEAYAKAGDTLTEQVFSLLMELIYAPYLPDGAFCPDYTSSERQNVLDRIAAQKNDPRSYAPQRLVEVMCKDEAFGVPVWGTEKQVQAVTATSLCKAYEDMLQNAQMDIFYCGSLSSDMVAGMLTKQLPTRAPVGIYQPTTEIIGTPKGDAREIRESLPVAQGKLSIGFRTGGNTLTQGDSLAAWVLAVLYGGSMTAKLFLSVREKLSLCYYASAQYVAQKGLLMVHSGIENGNYEVARDEILRQFALCQQGEITQEEIAAAKKALVGAWKSVQDDPLQLEHFWLVQSIAGTMIGPEMRLEEVQKVNYERVCSVAKQTQLDTVYFLEGVAK